MQKSGAVGDVDLDGLALVGGEELQQALEEARLARGRLVLELVGRGEVRHHAGQLEIGMGAHCGERVGDLARRQTQPVHPRVDLEVDSLDPGGSGAPSGPGAQLLGAGEGHDQIVTGEGLGLFGQARAHDQDVAGETAAAQLRPLLHQSHGEPVDPARGQLLAHSRGAVPVGVGLEDGTQGDAPGAETRGVSGQRIEVDGCPGGAKIPGSLHSGGCSQLRSRAAQKGGGLSWRACDLKVVVSPMKTSGMRPVSPLRCLATMSSARPLLVGSSWL